MTDRVSQAAARELVLDHARLPGSAAPCSITIADGRITAIHDEAPPSSHRSAAYVDLDGAHVLPGLWDTHVHLEQWALARRQIDLRHAASPREAVAAVAAAAATRPPGETILGFGYRDGLWAADLHKDLFQAAAPDRVVMLQSSDLHAVALSPAALVRIGRPDHPTGVLLEADCHRATPLLQEHDPADIDRWVAAAVADAAARGVTGIIDFEIGDPLLAWQRRTQHRPPDVRIVCTVYREHLDTAIARGMPSGAVVPGTHGLVEVGPLKLFVDGSLNSRTALCFDAYPEHCGSRSSHGSLETPPEELLGLLRRAAGAGIDGAVHAIGDRANGIALDAFEQLGRPGRIEHAQLLAVGDARRFAALGVIAGVQPAHVLDDREVADRHWPGRTDRAFAYRGLIDAGVRLEFGSDAPVAALDPWLGIAAAVTRTSDDREPWHPEQRLDVAHALRSSSRGRTRVRIGDPADIVVVDRDPIATPPAELTAITVLGTLLGGRWTHRVQ